MGLFGRKKTSGLLPSPDTVAMDPLEGHAPGTGTRHAIGFRSG